jgi:hypothetical protein
MKIKEKKTKLKEIRNNTSRKERTSTAENNKR